MSETLTQHRDRIHAKMKARHQAAAKLPIEEKVRHLLEMQRKVLPNIAARRPLQWWEKPWDIEP